MTRIDEQLTYKLTNVEGLGGERPEAIGVEWDALEISVFFATQENTES